MTIHRVTITPGQKPTPEQLAEIRALKDRPIVYDEDAPELTKEMTRVRQITPWKDVTISNGLMFRFLMERPTLCQKLLERILNIRIKNISVPEFEKDFRIDNDSKGVRLDVYLEDVDGVAIDIEMQALELDREAIGRRARYYQSVMDTALLPKGSDYTELKKSYIIFICTFDPFDAGLARYTFTNICHEDSTVDMCDGRTTIFLNAKGDRRGLTEQLSNFLAFVNGEEPHDSFVDELKKNIAELKLDQEKRGIYMTYSQELLRSEARGRAAGKLEGLFSVALNMLRDSEPLEKILRYSNLSADDVRKLAKDNGLSIV